MKKSNIILALLAGAAVGGIIAIVLKTQNAIIHGQQEEDEEESFETPRFKKIAQQFSDKISSELKSAESKIKSVVKKTTDFNKSGEENGVFL